ncbi:RNA polymerase sigma factor [Chloroflexota bacterium]
MVLTSEGTASADSANIILVQRAAKGDFEAFGELYDVYLEQIYRYVYHQLKEKMTAEDITEEVFVKAWKSIKSCRGKEKTFKAWLYRIAHNQVVDYYRYQKRETGMYRQNIVDESNPVQNIEQANESERLFAEISSLPRNQKQVVILRFIEGLEHQEVSKIMGKSQGAIRVLQVRALATLRKRFLTNGMKNE